MNGILKKEFMILFKSFKSIAVIFFFLIVSFAASKFFSNNLSLLESSSSNSVYASSIRALVMFLGFMFIFSISHDVINREIENQTMRFLVTKVSRISIILGKFLGVLLFWFVCISASFLMISIFSKQFYINDFLEIISLIIYGISLCMLLSLLISKSSYTMFLGILLGIIIPIIGIYSSLSSEGIYSVIKFIFPYYYIINGGFYIIVPYVISFVLLFLTVLIFKRRDV